MISALRNWLLEDKILKGLQALQEIVKLQLDDIKKELENMTATLEDLKAALQTKAQADAEQNANVAKLLSDVQALLDKHAAGEDFTDLVAQVNAGVAATQASNEAVKAADVSVANFITPAPAPAPAEADTLPAAEA